MSRGDHFPSDYGFGDQNSPLQIPDLYNQSNQPVQTPQQKKKMHGKLGLIFGGIAVVFLILSGMSLYYVWYLSWFNDNPEVAMEHLEEIADVSIPDGFSAVRSIRIPRRPESMVAVLCTNIPDKEFQEKGLEGGVGVVYVYASNAASRNIPYEISFMVSKLGLKYPKEENAGEYQIFQTFVGGQMYIGWERSFISDSGLTRINRYSFRLKENVYIVVSGPKSEVNEDTIGQYLRSVGGQEPLQLSLPY